MQVLMNGEHLSLEPGTTVGSFLKDKNVDPETVVVELNGAITDKNDYDAVPLKENDRLEVLRFVSGG